MPASLASVSSLGRPRARLAVPLSILLLATACGPERPPAEGSYASTAPAEGLPSPSPATARKDLPETAYQVAWGEVLVPKTIERGQQVTASVTFKNNSPDVWPATGQGELYVVRLGQRWLERGGKAVFENYGERRIELPHPLDPGRSLTLAVPVTAPTRPGSYVIQFDLVHEGVSWFEDRRAARLLVPVKVS